MHNRTILGVTAVLLIAGLSACSPNPDPASQNTPAGTPTESSTAEPTPDDADPVDPNVMFTITATLHSADGATADLKQVVYRPVAQTDSMTADLADFDNPDYLCGDWRSEVPGALFLVGAVTVTDTSPSGSSWPETDWGVALVSSGGATMYTGEMQYGQAPCDTPVYARLGGIRTVSLVNPSDPDAAYGWASHSYGFIADPSENSMTSGATIDNCSLDISAYALAESTLTPTWSTQSQDGTTCEFGTEVWGL